MMDKETLIDYLDRFKLPIIVTLMVLVLGGAGVMFVLEDRRSERSKREGDALYVALKKQGGELVNDLEGITADAAGGHKAIHTRLAALKLANIYTEDKEKGDSAASIYSNLISDDKLIQEIRDLADYLLTILSIGSGKVDSGLESKLVKLASKDGPYKTLFKEALVVLKLKNKETNTAVGILREILWDASSSPQIKRNAESLLRVYEDR